jgi:hypothetical protein
MFTSFHGVYIPLTWVSYALDYELWGMNPKGYHLSSLILHSANAGLMYFLGSAFLQAADPDRKPVKSARPWAAVFIALFFSLHPLRVEPVAWATAKRDVLAAFFFLLTLLVYLKSHVKGGRSTGAGVQVVGVVLFLASLLSKASGMFLPIVLVLFDIYPLKRLPTLNKSWFDREARTVWMEKIPYLALSFLAVGVAGFSQLHIGTTAPWAALGLSERAFLIVNSLAFYVTKTLWPFGLSPFYPLPADMKSLDHPWLCLVVFAAAILLLMWAVRRSYRTLTVLVLMYGVLVAPTSGIFQSNQVMVADRYSYLAAIPLALGLGYGGKNRARTLTTPWPRWMIGLFACAWLFGLAALTRKQLAVWKNSETLWRSALKVYPENGEAHNNLGTFLQSTHRLEEATLEFQRAVDSPRVPISAINNLGAALAEQGRFDEAIPHFQHVLTLDPTDRSARMNLDRAQALQSRRGR